MIREMLATFYEDLMVKYQRVTAFGISFTERNKRNDRFFKYVNLVFYHYKFTLDREPHRPVFFTTWSQRLWDLAENAVLTAFKVPARCADEAAPRQTAAETLVTAGVRIAGQLVRPGDGGRGVLDTAAVELAAQA